MLDPHPASAETAYLDASALARLMDAGELSSREVVATLLDRAAAIDMPGTEVELRALAALSADAVDVAAERDRERRAGSVRGPLHGIPVLVKDNIEARGLPGLAGSTSLRGRPAREAPLVARLRAAGAVVMGSTNLSQWANLRSLRSTSGWSASGGLVANPWALDRSAGGSSSGAGAALAAGLAPLCVGTETDGSIVCPASLNGVSGLKPSVGLVPTRHVVPISASQDSPGPMARRAGDLAPLLEALARWTAPSSGPPTRIVAAANWRTGHPRTDARFDDLLGWLKGAGVDVARREVAEPREGDFEDELTVLLCEMRDDLSAYLSDRPGEGVASLADVVAFEHAHADLEMPHFGHDLFERALATAGRADALYAPARRRNLEWARATCLGPALEGADVLLAPAYGPSWKSDLTVGGHPGPASNVTTPAGILGWPIAAVPMGLVDGLPVGVALVARPGNEWRLLQAAARVEGVVDDHAPLTRPTWLAPSRG